MDKVCSRSTCSVGGAPQPETSFYLRDGKPVAECKACVKARAAESQQRRKDERREYMREYMQKRRQEDPEFDAATKAAQRRHDSKPHRREKNRDYFTRIRADPERYAALLAQQRINAKRWRERHKDRVDAKYEADRDSGKRDARAAVSWAMKLGVLTKTGVCATPGHGGVGCFGDTEWHHDSYIREDWLKVREVCKRHHRVLDRERSA